MTKCPNCGKHDFSITERWKMIYRWRDCPVCGVKVKLSRVGLALFSGLVTPLVGLGLLIFSSISFPLLVVALIGLVFFLEVFQVAFSKIITKPSGNEIGRSFLN